MYDLFIQYLSWQVAIYFPHFFFFSLRFFSFSVFVRSMVCCCQTKLDCMNTSACGYLCSVVHIFVPLHRLQMLVSFFFLKHFFSKVEYVALFVSAKFKKCSQSFFVVRPLYFTVLVANGQQLDYRGFPVSMSHETTEVLRFSISLFCFVFFFVKRRE